MAETESELGELGMERERILMDCGEIERVGNIFPKKKKFITRFLSCNIIRFNFNLQQNGPIYGLNFVLAIG